VLGIAPMLPAYSLAGWTTLTSPGGDNYHPLKAPVLLYELAGVIALALATALMLALYFGKRSSYPRMMIGYLWGTSLYLVLDEIFVRLLHPDQPRGDAADVVRSIIGAAIWTAYLLRSERVANTFVVRWRQKPTEHTPPQPALPAVQAE